MDAAEVTASIATRSIIIFQHSCDVLKRISKLPNSRAGKFPSNLVEKWKKKRVSLTLNKHEKRTNKNF
jgi:hypothetical protein